MTKPFTTIVPPSFKAASETYQYAPAVRISDQILISGIVGPTPRDGFLPTFAVRRRTSLQPSKPFSKRRGRRLMMWRACTVITSATYTASCANSWT